MINIWVHSADADVIVISESWLSKSVMDKDIIIDSYNVYRADVGGGSFM